MTTFDFSQHYGKQYTFSQLSDLTERSLRTFQRWQKEGLITKTQQNPVIYRINDPEDESEIHTIDLSTDNENLSDQSLLDLTEEMEDYDTVTSFLEAVKHAKQQIYLTHKPHGNKSYKILSLSDIHCPFHNEKLIKEILELHKDADAVILNGDIIDGYGASSFVKDKNITILQEYNQAMDLVTYISNNFPMTILVKGNHDQRVDRYFSKSFDPHMLALAQKDILWRLAKGYVYDDEGTLLGQRKYKNKVVYNPNGQPWWVKVGKTIFMHPSSYSGQILKTVAAAKVHVENYVNSDAYDSIIIGHTHKVGKTIEQGKMLIEQGCLCNVMDYQTDGKFVSRPSVSGYAVIYQDEAGNTNFNDSNYIYCGTLNALKKGV